MFSYLLNLILEGTLRSASFLIWKMFSKCSFILKATRGNWLHPTNCSCSSCPQRLIILISCFWLTNTIGPRVVRRMLLVSRPQVATSRLRFATFAFVYLVFAAWRGQLTLLTPISTAACLYCFEHFIPKHYIMFVKQNTFLYISRCAATIATIWDVTHLTRKNVGNRQPSRRQCFWSCRMMLQLPLFACLVLANFL